MPTTTRIQVSAVDNELYIIAIGNPSFELCHLTSGMGADVSYTISPQSVLTPGQYTLILIGINWGGPQNFRVTLTTGGVANTLTAPASSAIGANWTVAVPITV